MKTWQKSLALLLAITLLVTCGIAGIVLPAAAAGATQTDLFNGQGGFEDDAWKSGALNDFGGSSTEVVADPLNSGNQVLKIGKTDEDGNFSVSYDAYFKFNKLYNAETETNNMTIVPGKAYTLSFDVLGSAIAFYANHYTLSGYTGWTKFNANTTAWTHYEVNFYPNDDIATYHDSWHSWYMEFAKNSTGNSATYCDATAPTYLDNIKLVESVATSVTLDTTSASLKPGETLQLTATTAPARAPFETIVWSSSNTKVATVDATGKVTVKNNGTATITATSGSLTATCTVTADDNLFPAGNFEGANDANVFTGGLNSYMAIEDGVGFGGGKALVFGASVAANKDQYLRVDKAALESNSRYYVEFMVKGAVKDDIQLYVQSLTNCSMSGQYTIACGDGWVKYRVVLTTGENPSWIAHSVALIKRSSASYPIYVDNVAVRKVTDSMNLLTNEDDFSYLGWEWSNHVAGGYVESATDPDDSNNSVLKFNAATGAAHASLWAVPVEKNTNYTLTFRAKGAQIAAYFSYTTNGSDYWHYTTASDDWREYTWHITTNDSPNGNYIIDFGRTGSSNGAVTYIDDIRFVKTQYATGMTLDKTTASVELGKTLTLNTVATPEGSFLAEAVTWTSSAPEVATVSNGVVTPVSGGTTTITATSGSLTATATVTVTYPVEHFVNGDLETASGAVNTVWFGKTDTVLESGKGYNGSTALSFSTNGARYMQNQRFLLKPNSYYLFTALARTDDSDGVATVYINDVGSTNNNVVDITRIDHATMTLGTEWTVVTYRARTGDNPSMNSNWNFEIRPEGLSDGNVYLDNLSFRLMEDEDCNSLTTDFEGDSSVWGDADWRYGKLVEGAGIDGSDAFRLPNQSGTNDLLRQAVKGLDKNAVYKLSFYTRADAEWIAANGSTKIYWGGNNTPKMAMYADTGEYLKATAEWQLNAFVFATGEGDTINGNTFYLDGRTTGDGYLYMDNVKFERIDTGNAVTTKGSSVDLRVQITGTEKVKYLAGVTPGTKVTVQAYPYNGYVLTPGSLVLTQPDGTVLPILNKNDTTFGAGDGTFFEFVMPAGGGQVSLTMASTSTNGFAMDTIATSVHTNGSGENDGIRFLTRLALPSFTATAEGLTVKYNGADATVTEFGSLLVREGNEADLTYDAAKWKAVAYKKGEIDTMKLVDYTQRYIDFTSVMMTNYADRTYSAKGYLCLDTDGDGMTDVTVYSTNVQTDSVNSAAARL